MKIYQAESSEHQQHVRELFWEYLQWANQKVEETFNVSFDIAAMLEADMQTLAKFSPPDGRLLLGEVDGHMAGVVAMKPLNATICEIKRMYVRPAFRRRGLGHALVQQLVDDAKHIGYKQMRLDSPRFMTAAHALYRSFGFQEIAPYAGSEIPTEFQQHWIFMELRLK
jgi:GNAT superfamily N-acetyltransferase